MPALLQKKGEELDIFDIDDMLKKYNLYLSYTATTQAPARFDVQWQKIYFSPSLKGNKAIWEWKCRWQCHSCRFDTSLKRSTFFHEGPRPDWYWMDPKTLCGDVNSSQYCGWTLLICLKRVLQTRPAPCQETLEWNLLNKRVFSIYDLLWYISKR